MKKFRVFVEETLTRKFVYEVTAKNEDEAANHYIEGVCVKVTEPGKEESGGEEAVKVEEIK